MTRRSREAEALARLLDQASRSLHSLGYEGGLFPAQWTALRYFDRAEPRQRTASALARFQGLAVGPVTRTVRTLATKGLLRTVSISGRGGAKQLELTEAARDLMRSDPLGVIVETLETMSDAERVGLAAALELILGRVQGRRHESAQP